MQSICAKHGTGVDTGQNNILHDASCVFLHCVILGPHFGDLRAALNDLAIRVLSCVSVLRSGMSLAD